MKTCIRLVSSLFLLCAIVLINGCGSSGSSSPNPPQSPTGPVVSSISPTKIPAGSAAFTLTVTGSGFTSSTVIQVNQVAESTSFVSSTQVTAAVPANQVTAGGNFSVVAVNGAQGSSGASVGLEVDNPAPTITQLSVSTLVAAAGATSVTVTGTNFVPSTVINVNGSARATTYVSATEVKAMLTDADLAGAGTLSVTAVNSAPGGGTSSALTIAVSNPVPKVTGVSPTSVLIGTSTPTTITLTGSNFVPTSTVQVNGTNRTSTFVSSTKITFQLTAADQASAQAFALQVVNPAPGGGSALAGDVFVMASSPTPVISQVQPNQLVAGSGDTTITVWGTNLAQPVSLGWVLTSTVMWNGTALTTVNFYPFGSVQCLTATVPANLLTSVGTSSVTVSSTVSTPATSNALTVSITDPPAPTLTSIWPNAGPINTDTTIQLSGTGFTEKTTVALNGVNMPASYVNSTTLKADIPASSIAMPGNLQVTVTTPAPGGGTSAALPYTAYLGIANNDMVYNAKDGLLYASIPGSVPVMGNSIIGIDPVTGSVTKQIFAGSNPNKLALSADGTQIFVGLDGAAAVAQINLSTGNVVSTFPLGGGQGMYNYPYTAESMAAVPGMPNSVAVLSNNGVISIFDSGVARPKNSTGLINTYFNQNTGSLSFGSSSSTLYAEASPFQGLEQFTVDATGITAGKSLSSTNISGNIQYDNGRLYLSNGVVLDATSGNQLGTFYASSSQPATGPVVSDSNLGLAFIASYSYTTSGSQVLAFNESTFNPAGNIGFNPGSSGYPSNYQRIVRWGQNGIALNTSTQIFILQSPVVKDLSPSPADLSVTMTAPATATTGSTISYVATVKNSGPNQAQGAALALNLDSSLIVSSVTPSQGTCDQGTSFNCDLGSMANGASVTVTVNAIPSASGTLAGSAVVNSVSTDPTASNNQATTSTTVTGSIYGAAPSITGISPALVQAGSAAFTLTVNGTGFNDNSTVNLNGSPLATTYVSATQLTASVDATSIAKYGWASVTVSNPSPGGGNSAVAPLTIYALLNVPANHILFDPYSQQIYASVPSASTTLTGNSIVTVDPVAAKAGTPINIGSEPNVMAETSDGRYLYVGVSGAKSLAQFDTLQQKLIATVPLSITQYGTTSSVAATWLSAMPGSETTLAIGTNGTWGTTGIFDITGSGASITGAFRPNFTGIYNGDDAIFADATHLYALDTQTSGGEFYRYSVDANGATLIDGSSLNGLGGFSGSFQLANGLVYGGGGGIVNPSTTPPSQVAMLDPLNFYSAGITASPAAVVPDPSAQKDFVILINMAGSYAYDLVRYNTTQYLAEDQLILPNATDGGEYSFEPLRWGQDGLALRLSEMNYGAGTSTAQIMLLRGPFVLPQLLGQGTPATLTSSSQSTFTHGAGNTVLTLTGSNFQPGVAVTWNGNYRTTTIVDSSHVTVALPASDFAAAGSGSLVATNPGAAASSALTISVN